VNQRTASRGLPALLSVVLVAGLSACARLGLRGVATDGPPSDPVPAASRCGFGRSGFTSPAFVWEGERAPLARRGVAGYPRSRLVLDATDGRGGTTEFLLDTGTSCVLLAHTAPAARDASQGIERLELLANSGATSFTGRDAVLPVLDLGGLRGRDVPVFLLERSHDLRSPANVLGMVLLTGLALVHEPADAWALVRADRLGATPANAQLVRQQARGLPVVRLEGPDGRTVYGLVDTGTPTSLYGAGSVPGRYRLADEAGATALEFRAVQQAPWASMRAGGHPISVWIGLDALERRAWTMDFSTGEWRFPPVAAPGER
jgi:hypothetical protein